MAKTKKPTGTGTPPKNDFSGFGMAKRFRPFRRDKKTRAFS